MSLPPAAQTLIDQLVMTLGMQALPLEFLEIHFDKDRLAVTVKPRLTFKRPPSPETVNRRERRERHP